MISPMGFGAEEAFPNLEESSPTVGGHAESNALSRYSGIYQTHDIEVQGVLTQHISRQWLSCI